MRFFVTADVSLYEQTRAALDAAWGLPNESGTITCISPAEPAIVGRVVLSPAPRDDQGRIMLAVDDEWCGWEPAATMLPKLLATGAVQEISLAAYMAGMPKI